DWISDVCSSDLSIFPFDEIRRKLYVKINDDHAEWNQCIFRIAPDRTVSIQKEADSEKLLTMDIGPFSSMLMGYHDIHWYKQNDYAQLTDEMSKEWQCALPSGFPSFNEHF